MQCVGGGVAKACEHIQEVTAVSRPHAHHAHARVYPITKSHQVYPVVKSNYMQICGRNEGGGGANYMRSNYCGCLAMKSRVRFVQQSEVMDDMINGIRSANLRIITIVGAIDSSDEFHNSNLIDVTRRQSIDLNLNIESIVSKSEIMVKVFCIRNK